MSVSDFVRVPVRRTTRWLAVIAAVLVVIHVVMQIVVGPHTRSTLVNFFDVGLERNVPTFFASFLWVLAALLTGLIASYLRGGHATDSRYWWGLTLCFVGISIDEYVGLHERLIGPVRNMLDTSGPLFYAWVIPYSILTFGFLLIYVRFLMRLPRRTAILFVVAGGIFVGGAVGFEMLSGWELDAFHGGIYANRGPLYIALQTIEETLELVGVITFIYACLDHADRIGLSIRIGSVRKAASGTAELISTDQRTDDVIHEAAAAAEALASKSQKDATPSQGS